ncbi:MAG: hypothetical protein ABIJ40_19295 [Bacteroidota bacterium]
MEKDITRIDMRTNIKILILFILLFNSCQINEPTNNDGVEGYRTTIYSLSDTELSVEINEYRKLNDSLICTSLNEFGYPEYDLAPCSNRPILREELNKDESVLINLAKTAIIKNQKYTGVENSDELSIRRTVDIIGCIKCDGSNEELKTIKWRIDYNNQVSMGYEVFDTEIIVFLDNNGVFMLGGNWYSDIVVPSNNLYTLQQVKETLVGLKRTIYCWTNYEIEITSNNLPNEARKVIIPYKNGDKIELRLTWEIIISDYEYVFYIDVVNGEIIKEMQLVIC